MATIRLEEFGDGIVIYFKTDAQRINAYTLASTLVSFADAARAANRTINPGYEIEIVVEALAPGSFRTRISAVYSGAGNLFTAESLRNLILGVAACFIYEAIHPPAKAPQIIIETNEVIIVSGEDRVVVPRNVYVATQEAKANPQFTSAMSQLITNVAGDSSINGLGFAPSIDSPAPEIVVSRENLLAYLPQENTDQPVRRDILEVCDLQIVKAILERSDRKWEFRWRGIKVSAALTDQSFYSNFFAHRITIAPGDELRVRMKITQSRQPESNIYTNVGYEVIEVLSHTPKVQQFEISPVASLSDK
jgi:hypothetical protein